VKRISRCGVPSNPRTDLKAPPSRASALRCPPICRPACPIGKWRLHSAFLAVAGESIGPIRSFDISPETLALAAGVDPSFGDQVVASFKQWLLENRSTLYAALEDGIFNTKLAPDCSTFTLMLPAGSPPDVHDHENCCP
jgi:hypothetical protein